MNVALFHQAHLLPWPGYVARCLDCNMVVFLSDVNFNKGYYHNRTKFIDVTGQLQWLTIPVWKKTASWKLKDVAIVNPPLFKKWFRKFKLSYEKEKNFNEVWNFIEETFQNCYPSLNSFNQEIIKQLVVRFCEMGNIPVPVFFDSSLFEYEFVDKTERLLVISKKLKIGKILMGKDSLQVHDLKKLDDSGIVCLRHIHCSQDVKNPSTISIPISGLTILHYIIKDGWNLTAKKLIDNWYTIKEGGENDRI